VPLSRCKDLDMQVRRYVSQSGHHLCRRNRKNLLTSCDGLNATLWLTVDNLVKFHIANFVIGPSSSRQITCLDY